MVEWIASNWGTAVPIVVSVSSLIYTSMVWKKQRKLEAGLARSKAAYDIILKKEFEFYEKIDPIFAELIPGIHDIISSLTDSYPVSVSLEERKEVGQKNFVFYGNSIIELKSHYLSYDIYLPREVSSACSCSIQKMQMHIEFLKNMLFHLFEEQENLIDKEECEQVGNKILYAYVLVRGSIVNRLNELSEI